MSNWKSSQKYRPIFVKSPLDFLGDISYTTQHDKAVLGVAEEWRGILKDGRKSQKCSCVSCVSIESGTTERKNVYCL